MFDERYEAIVAKYTASKNEEEAIKRAESPNYYKDSFFVPKEARWATLHKDLHKGVGDGLNTALQALEDANPDELGGVLHHINFMRMVGRTRLQDKPLRDLIKHFNKYRLRNEDFEYPDLLGAAYEYLIRDFADSAGKKGGEFYTPRSVVRMMVRIAAPEEGMRIYDPCSGSGGMLVLSKEYLDEHNKDSNNLSLFGQESNGSVWAISKMNMLLHGISDADIQNGDTLASPAHTTNGQLTRFDRILTNPPFSQNYTKQGIEYPARFKYGYCPEGGKKADLMFVQHMISVMRDKGMVITVMPHGVLFRGGEERKIRTGILDDDLLDAVIGLGANLFYGTGIPACLLVLRAKGSKPKERQGKVLFINADREYYEGRAQNYLYPEHIEKIVSAWHAFETVDGFARVVDRAELAENDDNLNIRRYADNAPPPEPHDVRAHLFGGIPRAELAAKADLFSAHGFDPHSVLADKDEKYFDFASDLSEKRHLKKSIEANTGLLAKEKAVTDAVDAWWKKHVGSIEALPTAGDLSTLRAELLESFETSLRPVGVLDRFKVAGVIATWWGDVQNDLKSIAARGFLGLVEAWETSILTAMEDTRNKDNPLDHRLVRRLLPQYLEDISELEAKKAELDATIKSANKSAADDEDEESEEEGISEEELKAHKSDLKAVKKKLKTLNDNFKKRLTAAREALDEPAALALVTEILRSQLDDILQRYVADHRQQIVAAFEGWWDKYRVTLTSIETERDAAAGKLREFLGGLGYA